jgi:DNA polymerase III alpha subunit
MKELSQTIYFTTEHGYGGDIFEARQLCDKEGLKCVFALEAYCVVDSSLKDDRNYHIVIIAKTNTARRKLNLISSNANKHGYYRKPRISLEQLLSLDKDDIYITTACTAGIIRDEDGINMLFIPLYNKFKNNLFIETQTHNHISQVSQNIRALELSNKFGVELCHANDSHYIYPKQSKDRLEFLQGKKIDYGDENSFILDYPSYNTILDRYKEQGVLTEKQARQALDNTMIFSDCEGIDIDYSVKMPTIYPNLTIDEKHKKLYQIVVDKFKQIYKIDNIKKEDFYKYADAIKFEFNIIKETQSVNTVDYFLLNERIIDIAINKYNGVLTKTGRGSNVAFYINRLLGFTEIDRITSEIPLYPTRFMSKSRILETKSMPDCDYNTKDPKPFIQATRDILGKDNCYWMIAYGTMQESEAFRNLCRTRNLDYDEYNEVAKNIDNYRKDEFWSNIINESEKYVDSVISASPHPCANLLLDKSVLEEIGIVKIGDEFCALIDSDEADTWKYLKNDYLTVKVWEIIDETFKLLNQPIMSIQQIKNNLDEKVWNIYAKGLTSTINQVDGDWATELMMKFKAKTIEELAMFTSSIRPFFQPWRDIFINRQEYTTGTPQLDKLFSKTKHMILFQENLMQFLSWLGIEEDKTIGLIKKISKKKITQEEFAKLQQTLHNNWIKQVGDDKKFNETWEHIQSCLEYGYNSPHALAMTYDSLYCAYLKSHYPMEYFTVVLNLYQDDTEKTERIIKELPHFNINLNPIKFRYSTSLYNFDIATKSIYKGIGSLKHCNSIIGEELFNLGENTYSAFVELLIDIAEKTSVNSRQLEILIRLDFFSEFGKPKKLYNIYMEFAEGKNRYDIKHKPATKEKRTIALKEIEKQMPNDKFPISETLLAELEYYGYISTTIPTLSYDYAVVTDINAKWKNPILTLHHLSNGEIETIKIKKNTFIEYPLKVGDMIKIKNKIQDWKWSMGNDGKFKRLDVKEWFLTEWNFVK